MSTLFRDKNGILIVQWLQLQNQNQAGTTVEYHWGQQVQIMLDFIVHPNTFCTLVIVPLIR